MPVPVDGRPFGLGPSPQITFRLTRDDLDALDRYRQAHGLTRNEALRRLVRTGAR